jgi:excisionase family DNA binding protein
VTDRKEWLTLGEASRLLGVDPDTLRRWADAGKIEVFVTPGGHRRFARAAVEALVPAPPRASRYRTLDAIGAPPDRIAADLRRRVRADIGAAPWSHALDEADRQAFRERGRAASALLLRYLNSTRKSERERLLFDVEDIGRAYGREAREHGLSLGEAAEALLFFRAQFISQMVNVARRRSLPPAQSAQLFAEADRALDRMLLALIEAHQQRRPAG